MKIRHYIPGEILPDKLKTGYESGQNCDPQWIWIAENDGKPVAILVTAPAHVVAILMRIICTDDAPKTAVHAILAHSFVEMMERGYKGYVTWVNPSGTDAERALLGIVRAAGGVQFTELQVCCSGLFMDALKRKAA